MRTFIGFVIGVAAGIALSFGVLISTGHMNANTSKVAYVVETTQFDGFSFR